MRLDWRDALSTGGYLVLVPLGFQVDQPVFRSAVLSILFLSALLAWLVNLQRLHAIRDTPTSRIASAAQGYVELSGVGRAVTDQPVYSPSHHLPCLWYRYRAFVREGDKWRQTESGTSDAQFLLDDGSGLCLLDPSGADIATNRKETYNSGDSRVEEELLLAGDTLYALGDFSSQGGGHSQFDEREELARILSEWKDDQAELHRRFDLDGNGEIDPQEWQLARQAAKREMEARRTETMNRPVAHSLGHPRSGRPYLIANFQPEYLVRHYRNRVWAHGLVTLASLFWLAASQQPG